MFEMKAVVPNPTGLHARPASQFTVFCKKYPNDITIVFGEKRINPKSIINIIAAGLKQGSEVTVQVEGDNAEAICKDVVGFINNLKD